MSYEQLATAVDNLAAVNLDLADQTRVLVADGESWVEDSRLNKEAAAASAISADASEAAAETYKVQAGASATSADVSEAAALAHKNAAATSETNSFNSAGQSSASAAAALVSKSAAADSQVAAEVAKDAAEDARDRAEQAAATVVGVISDRGPVDLSGGVYPAAPTTSSMWKVTVGGTVGGVEYGVGDTLMYTLSTTSFYKIDNTELVSSVAGKTGAITLDKVDVGLPLVDNTSDVNKPVSTPQQNALDLKVAISDIINNVTSTATDKPLSAAQGKFLYDLLQANNATIVRYTYNVAQGQTVITGNDLNGLSLAYVPGTVMLVELNGFPLWLTNDYTATSGTSIVLTTAAELAGEISITVFGSFSVANHYTKAESNSVVLNTFAGLPIASAATIDIGNVFSHTVNVSGTTTITSLGASAPDGARKTLRFSGALILTHNATSLILLGSANIATAAGDSCLMLSLGGGNWVMLSYTRADGRPLAFAYDRASAVAAVSGTAGSNTGGIVSSYTTAGINVTKWADGTMVMSGGFNAVAVTADTYANINISLPEAFHASATARCGWTMSTNNNGATAGLMFLGVIDATMSAQFCFNRVSTSAINFIIHGRWKGY